MIGLFPGSIWTKQKNPSKYKMLIKQGYKALEIIAGEKKKSRDPVEKWIQREWKKETNPELDALHISSLLMLSRLPVLSKKTRNNLH